MPSDNIEDSGRGGKRANEKENTGDRWNECSNGSPPLVYLQNLPLLFVCIRELMLIVSRRNQQLFQLDLVMRFQKSFVS